MKKNYFLLIAIMLFVFAGYSQNIMLNGDLEEWTDSNTPTSWKNFDNISQESDEKHGGMYSAAQESASDRQDLTQEIGGIAGGQQYTISYYYKDNDPAAKARIWSYWLSGGSTMGDNESELRPMEYSEDNAEWQHFSVTLTSPTGADGFRFEVRLYKEDDMFGGHVYYDDFSVVGATTDFPEPSNYPTDFAAETSGLNINVTWTDAVGEQLPGAYLLLGKVAGSGDFQTPVDGTPVTDDLDWSDNSVALNVGYGLGAYDFSNMMGDKTYEFTIFPYTNVGEKIDYKTDGTAPTASAFVSGITVINYEDFNDGTLGTWTEYNVTGEQVWGPAEYDGKKYAYMSGYSGGPVANEDWLISPVMDLSLYTDAIFNFTTATSYDGEALKLFLSQNYDGSGNPNDFTWLEITGQAEWSTGFFEWAPSGDVELGLYAYPTVYLAYKYVSSSDAAAAWEVDDILVYSEMGVGLFEQKRKELSFYPNPATQKFNLDAEQDGEISIVSLTGQTVYKQKVSTGRVSVSIENLPEGLYMIQFIGTDNSIRTGKLMVK